MIVGNKCDAHCTAVTAEEAAKPAAHRRRRAPDVRKAGEGGFSRDRTSMGEIGRDLVSEGEIASSSRRHDAAGGTAAPHCSRAGPDTIVNVYANRRDAFRGVCASPRRRPSNGRLVTARVSAPLSRVMGTHGP